MRNWTLTIVCVVLLWMKIEGHGRLVDPMGRDYAWRKYPDYFRVNYNDNQVFCGGFATHHEQNGGRCGFCGDDYSHPRPRNHERGGYYASNNIVAQYKRGSLVDVTVEITVNHYGVFYFDICVNDDPSALESDACFQKLIPVGAAPGTDYYTLPSAKTGTFTVSLQLPDHVTCLYCVLRWRYMAGNNWGCQTNSLGGNDCCVGCGTTQENFYSCSDVMVTDSGNDRVPAWSPPNSEVTLFTPSTTNATTTTTTTTTTSPTTTAVDTGRIMDCPSMCQAYCGLPGLDIMCGSYCCQCPQYRKFVSTKCTD